MIIGIVGSRRRNTFEDYLKLKKVFDEVVNGQSCQLVSGGCPLGADRFAEKISKAEGRTITIHYPDWKTHGKSAGFVRNTLIAESCDILIAVVAKDRTGGTEDTIRKAEKLGKRVVIVN